jgi:hypothetical protein
LAEQPSKLDQIRKLREARLLKAERAMAAAKIDEKSAELKKLAEDK